MIKLRETHVSEISFTHTLIDIAFIQVTVRAHCAIHLRVLGWMST